jgi:hypothetical protein
MSRVAVLVCEALDGKPVVMVGRNASDVTAAAKAARNAGLLDGQPIVSGIVFHSERSSPLMRFRCAPGEAVKRTARKVS